MGAEQSVEAAQEAGLAELAAAQGAAAEQADRQRLLGEIEATLLPLYLVLAKLNTEVNQINWTPTKTPLVGELPEVCQIVRVCRTQADRWILFANQVAAWLFYNQPTQALVPQAKELVTDMIKALEAWSTDLGADMSDRVRDWEERLQEIDQQTLTRRQAALSRTGAATRPHPSAIWTIPRETVRATAATAKAPPKSILKKVQFKEPLPRERWRVD